MPFSSCTFHAWLPAMQKTSFSFCISSHTFFVCFGCLFPQMSSREMCFMVYLIEIICSYCQKDDFFPEKQIKKISEIRKRFSDHPLNVVIPIFLFESSCQKSLRQKNTLQMVQSFWQGQTYGGGQSSTTEKSRKSSTKIQSRKDIKSDKILSLQVNKRKRNSNISKSSSYLD